MVEKSLNFFEELPGFTSFTEVCDPENYHQVPDDWFVVLTDVKDSTKAIQAGRYKDVNMVGAACITAVVNACRKIKIPYVFGGDGATFLVPSEYISVLEKELLGVSHFSQSMHGLSLRCGIIPMTEIKKTGKQIGVAKFIMETGAYLAMFNGGGVSYADILLKNNEKFSIQENSQNIEPNLEGLSCRWQPITPKHEVMMTLLVMAVEAGSDYKIYSEINKFLTEVLGPEQNPVHKAGLSYKWPNYEALRQSKMVWKQGNIIKNVLEHIFLITLFNVMNRFSLTLPGLNVPEYKNDMIMNSDYRKFDDMLRMVVDCTKDQAEKIERYLEEKRTHNQIVYGKHYSDTALMTCFLESLQKDKHIHFIDGNDGGYAFAAKQLKEQLSQSDKN